jgi:hypothetical protein
LSVRFDGHSYSYRPRGTHSTQMLCQFQISILHARVVADQRVDIILDAEYSEYKIVSGMNYVHSVPESNILRGIRGVSNYQTVQIAFLLVKSLAHQSCARCELQNTDSSRGPKNIINI